MTIREQIGNSVKSTESIESFDKVITWAMKNINDYTAIQVIRTLREKTVLKSIYERKKQTYICQFFQ